jgi:hypothetical protein
MFFGICLYSYVLDLSIYFRVVIWLLVVAPLRGGYVFLLLFFFVCVFVGRGEGGLHLFFVCSNTHYCYLPGAYYVNCVNYVSESLTAINNKCS